jgi:hypothetical protein
MTIPERLVGCVLVSDPLGVLIDRPIVGPIATGRDPGRPDLALAGPAQHAAPDLRRPRRNLSVGLGDRKLEAP